jgi:hypothetical protein
VANPFDRFDGASQPVPAMQLKPIIGAQAPPMSPAEAERLRIARAAEERAQIAFEGGGVPSGYRRAAGGGLEPIPGGPAAIGKALREGDADKLTADVDQLDALKRALNSFQEDFGGNLLGDVENLAQGVTGAIGTPGQRDWWADFRASDNVIRNKLFGASLTDGEKSAYNATTVTPRMAPSEIKKNLERRLEIINGATTRRINRLRAGGYNQGEIDAIAGPVLEQPVAKSVAVTLPNGAIATFPSQQQADAFKRRAGIR